MLSEMTFSAANTLVLVSALILVFALTCQSDNLAGRAHENPHLGAADAVVNEYVPEAEPEGQTYQNLPHEGIVGNDPVVLVNKALECFHDKNIYASCEEAYRLTQHGELNVPPEYTDQYCNGPCLAETHHVLNCIDGILNHFVFYNGATCEAVRETIHTGCSYGPERGNFNVAEHIQAERDSAHKMSYTVLYGVVLMIMAWRFLV